MLPLIRYKNQLFKWIGRRSQGETFFPGSESHTSAYKDLQLQQHSYRGHLFKIFARFFKSQKKYKLTVEETLSKDGIQLSAVLQGQLTRSNDPDRPTLIAGQYEISQPQSLQEAFQPGTACHFFAVHYSEALLQEFGILSEIKKTVPRPLTDDMTTVIQKTLRHTHEDKIRQMHYQNCIRELLFLHLTQADGSLPSHLSKGQLAAIFSADQYLRQTLQLPGTVANLARQNNMSESGLQKGFRKMFRMAVFQRLTWHRMQLATGLLQGTNRTIEDIAFEAGYGSRSSFTSAFKKTMKISPDNWRQRIHNR